MGINRAYYAEEAEKSVLGAMLRSEKALKETRFLTAGDFWSQKHGKIFDAIRQLDLMNRPVDLTTVDEQLGKMGVLEAVGGTAYLVDLMAGMPSAANVKAYAERVREASLMRSLKRIGESIVADAGNGEMEVSQILDDARAKLRELATPGNAWTSLQDAMIDAYEHLERVAKGEVKSIKTGITSLDWVTGGIFDGELTIIGARPAVGKSALGLQIALECGRQGKHACVASLEMTGRQLAQRVLSSGGMVDGMRMRTGALDANDWALMGNALSKHGETPVHLLSGIRYAEDLRMEVQKKVDKGECSLLVVDYLQLLNVRKRTSGDTERVGAVSRAMKALTLEFGIPVIALAQVNRKSENGAKTAPSMSELRSSGEIEQDADTVILLHKPENTGDDTVLPEHARLFNEMERAGKEYMVAHVAKQRQGQTGRVRFGFDPAHMRYFAI